MGCCAVLSLSAMSDTLPGSSVHGNSPGKNAGVGCHALLQGIFPTQGSNPGLPNFRWILYDLSHQGSPWILEWIAYPFSRGSSQPRNPTGVSCTAGRFFTSWATREALGRDYTRLMKTDHFPRLTRRHCNKDWSPCAKHSTWLTVKTCLIPLFIQHTLTDYLLISKSFHWWN